MLGANVKFTLSSHMYINMFMFLLLKPASANSQVTLVTCSGAFINTRFRKVWFYLVKRLLLLANVSKTPVPQPPPLPQTATPRGPWAEPSGPFCLLLAPRACFFASFVRLPVFFGCFSPRRRLRIVFFTFPEVRGPIQTPKNH